MWEAARQITRKLRWDIKPNAKGVVISLLIPITDNNGKVTWTTIIDKYEIYRLLVERNTRKLSMSIKTLFVMYPLADAIGPYRDNGIIVDKLLDGTATYTTLGLHLHDIDDELDALLTSLQYATIPTGQQIEHINDIITLEEYKNMCTKTREMTASSTSKAHKKRYIASCERDSITYVHLAMMHIPFYYVFTLACC